MRMRQVRGSVVVAVGMAVANPAVFGQACALKVVTPPTRQGVNGVIYALAAYDDGTGGGTELYVGGSFSNSVPAGPALGGVAKVVGGAYQPLPSGGPGSATAMEVFDDGGGSALWVVAGTAVKKWNGTAWTTGPTLPAAPTYALKAIDLGDGPKLYAGSSTTGPAAVFRLDGNVWTALRGTSIMFSRVHGLAGFDPDGPGPEVARLCVSGAISGAGGISGAAQWNGADWIAIPGAPSFAWSKSILGFDDGTGPKLHIGSHPGTGIAPNACISRWDGLAWTFPLSNPVNSLANPGYALAAIDFGPGLGPRVVSATTAGFVVSTPTGPWQVVTGSAACPATVTSYYGTMAAYHMPGSNVPVVVGVTSGGNGLQRLAGCPRCEGDRNLDGAADLTDLLDFLEVFFSTASGPPRVQQLFDFLAVWFAGC